MSTHTIEPQQVQNLTDGLLVGQFEHALDPKRRLTIPSVFREKMGHPKHLYVMPDSKMQCLNVLTPEEMKKIVDLLAGKLYAPGVGQLLAKLGSQCEDLQVDVQGRIRVRDAFLEFAQVDSQVLMIGAVTRVQLWSPKVYPTETGVNQKAIGDVLGEIGL